MEFRMELQAEHLSKSYRKKEALKDVNFKLEQGVYGLLGENGANTALRAELLSASGACPATTGAESSVDRRAPITHTWFCKRGT